MKKLQQSRKAFRVAALIFSVLITVVAHAQRVYTIGDVVADFRLKNVDERLLALSDFRNQKGVVIVFTSNHCPFAKSYEDRLVALNQRYSAQGIPVLAIQPNDPAAYEDDSFENMKLRARERNYPYPFVIDESQQVARAFGVTKTPQAFVLKQADGRFTVHYMGAIDDNPQDSNNVHNRYVEDAINSILTGRAMPQSVTKPIGCTIKWK